MKDFTIPNSSYSEDVLLFGERVSKWKDIDIAKELDIDNYIDYANVANAVQTSTQQALEYMVGHLYNMGQQKINNFAVTGGYAYNVVANGNLVKKYPSLNFYFEPNADDGGNSIGAAMAVYYWQTGNKPNLLHDCFYHGIEHELNITDGIDYTNVDCATDLARGKIVATYYGKAEAGPRALGHRSILHDPRNPNAKETVNEVKQREWYRPFAACVLEEYAHEWFSIPKNFASPHMTESYQVLKPTVIPGVVHVDGSCRIQTVNETNILYPILMEFYKQTGVPVLLNTSFNLHGQPLIETPDQAIDTLRSTYIDVLYFPKIEKCLENKG
jgi:carbamoyltransferase